MMSTVPWNLCDTHVLCADDTGGSKGASSEGCVCG